MSISSRRPLRTSRIVATLLAVLLSVPALMATVAGLPTPLRAQTTRKSAGTGADTTSTSSASKKGGTSGTGPVASPMIGGTAYLDVEPKGGTISGPSSGTVSTSFTVQNTGTTSTTGTFTVHSDGAISGCSVSPTSASVAVGAYKTLSVSCTTAATGSGSIYVDAGWPSANTDEGYVIVQLPSAPPLVTAAASTVWTAEAVSTNYPSFTVENNGGNTSAPYTLTATCGGNVGSTTCSVGSANPTASLAPNTSTTTQVNFNIGPASNGNGTVTLTARSPYGETSSQTITIVPLSENVSVTPGSAPAAPSPGQNAAYPFTVAAVGTNTSQITYTLTTSCTGAITCGTSAASPTTVTISPGSPASALVNITAASSPAGGSGTVSLTATYDNHWNPPYTSTSSFNVSVPAEQQATVAAPAGPVYDNVGSQLSRPFTIHNPNAFPESYTWSATCTSAVSCSGQSGSITVSGGITASVNVTYTTASTSPGSGSINFSAGDGAGTPSTSLSVILDDYSPYVVPLSGETGTLVISQTVVDTFNVRNGGNQDATYSVQASCDGAIASADCALADAMQARVGVDVPPGQTVAVPVRWTATGSASTTHVSLTATYTDAHGTWQQTGTRTLTTSTWPPSIGANGPPPGGFPANTTGLIQAFTVTNNGNTSVTYTFAATCSGDAVVSATCALVTPTPGPIAGGGGTATVQVRFTSGDVGTTGTVSLSASASPYSASSDAMVAINEARVSITPLTASEVGSSTAQRTRVFMLHNPNGSAEIYNWSAACSGAVSCSGPSGTTPVPARDSSAVSVSYTPLGAPSATGTLVFTASDGGGQSSSTISVRIEDYAVLVSATGSPGTPTAGVPATATFTVKNIGADSATYVLTSRCDNTAATQCQTPSVTHLPLTPSQQATVTVAYTAGADFTSGSVMLFAYPNGLVAQSDSTVFAVNVRTPGAMTVSTAFMNNDNQQVGACAASCFTAQYTLTTIPFYTVGAPRTANLVYNGDRAFPRPFVYADVSPNTSAGPVQQYSLEVRRNGADMQFTNGETKLYFAGSTVPVRLGGQIDMSTYSTDVYPVDVVVTALYQGGGSETVTSHARLLVVNEANSPIAKGWTIVGAQQIYERDSVAIITDGAGSAEVFTKCGTYCYQAPQGDFSTLIVEDSTKTPRTWQRHYPDGTIIEFGSNGSAWKQTDRTGRGIYIGRDSYGRISMLGDPTLENANWSMWGMDIEYGAYGISSIQEPSRVSYQGRALRFQVGADSLLAKAYLPNGDSVQFGYDEHHRLSTVTGSNHATTTYIYDPVTWKLVQITGPAVPTDAGNGSTALLSASVKLTPWQSVGVPTSPTSSVPATSSDTSKSIGQVADANGNISTFEVDRWGEPLVTTDPLGNVTKITRVGMLPTRVEAPSGVSLYSYDGPRLLTSQPAGDSITHYHYGVDSQVDSVWGPDVVAKHMGLNSNGTVAWVRENGDPNRTTSYTYDPLTHAVATVTDPTGRVTTMRYDATFGNLQATVYPGGQIDSATYDRYGRDSTTARTGYATSTTLYDLLNRPISVNDGYYPTSTAFAYDSLGRFSIITDPKGQSYRTEYDTLGRVTRRYDATGSGKFNSYRYDLGGRLTSSTNRRGQRVDVTYDSLGRALTRTDVSASKTDHFMYSRDGLQTGSWNDNAADTTWVNVSRGTQTTNTWLNGVEYVNGQTLHAALNIPDTSTTSALTFGATPQRVLGRDPYLGALGSVSLTGHMLAYDYNYQLGTRTTTTYIPPDRTGENGNQRLDSYAPTTGHLVEMRYTVPNTDSVLHRAYGYDAAGRLETEQTTANYWHDGGGHGQRQRRFIYDSLGRLTGVEARYGSCMPWPSDSVAPDSLDAARGWHYTCGTLDPDSSVTYTYDEVGNRTDHGAELAAGNRLVKFDGDTITYDDDGNMIRRYNPVTGEEHRYVWNAFGELDSAIVANRANLWTGISGSTAEHYLYDAYGHVVHTDRGWAVYDGEQISELVQTAQVYTDLAYDDGVDNPALEYVHTYPSDEWHAQVMDALGNVAGSVVNDSIGLRYTWDVWGANHSRDWNGMEVLGWKGLPTPTSTGLVNMRARWYDPDLGRFLSEDPIGLDGGINPYTFADDDPINGADPSGTLATDAQGGVCSITATSCGDPLAFPGAISAEAASLFGNGSATIGDVSFLGGVGRLTFSPGVLWKQVDAVLRAAVLSAAQDLDVTLNIFSAFDPSHAPGQAFSWHRLGLAVDINEVNGVRFSDMTDDEAHWTALEVGVDILSGIPTSRWREFFGPGFIIKFGGSPLRPDQIQRLLPQHRSHLHIAITPP